MTHRRLKLLSANIQAGSSTRGYGDYVARSWSHVLPAGNKRGSLDKIAQLAGSHDIVGLQEAEPGSPGSGSTNQTNRKSVGKGKSGSVRVNLGDRRIIKKKKSNTDSTNRD